jgi:hypothetical protein
VGFYAAIAIGGDGLPVVSYYDETNGDLKLLRCIAPDCAVEGSAAKADSP